MASAKLSDKELHNLCGSILRDFDSIASKGGARPASVRANADGIAAALKRADGSSNLAAGKATKAVAIDEDESLPPGAYVLG